MSGVSGMRSKSVEREAFLKSFSLFFLSLTVLLTALFYNLYIKERSGFDNKIFAQMRICSLELKCPKFTIDFVPSKDTELYLLKKNNSAVYALFPLPKSQKYVMKIAYPIEKYRADLHRIQQGLFVEFLLVEIVVALLSVLFSLFSLHPLRRALILTEEFVKDILHDFNTPLSIVRLNVRMLHKECPESKKVPRIEAAVETLLRLQENLRAYLGGHALQAEPFRLDELVRERTELIARAHPELRFDTALEPLTVRANKDAMIRILDNIIGNAAKYNKKGGSVSVILDAGQRRLTIEDMGVGIEHPEKVFQRFYKEHERGVGLGLHIVKKLCDEMGIKISVESRKGEGSRFTLDLHNLVLN
jgi:two-component system OmpR family sensor kinase